MTEPEPLTTDPPRPPGTPDVDDLVGEPVAARDRTRPDNEDTARDAAGDTGDEAGDVVSVEPPD